MPTSLRIILLSAVAFAVLSFGACGQGSAGGGAQASMRDELADPFGDAIADAASEAWRPFFDVQAELEAAEGDRDFVAYHAAFMKLRSASKSAVDGTIRALDSDPSWRRTFFAEAIASGGSGADPAASESGGAMGLFPTIGEPDEQWIARGAVENPRLAGELVRAAFDVQADVMRLGMYFVGAMTQEMTKAASEAMEGFRNPGG